MKVCLLRLLWLTLLVALLNCTDGSYGARPVPRFHLSIATQGVRIPAGGSAFVKVTLSRLNGFQEAVELSLVGAPEGVLAEGRIDAKAKRYFVAQLVEHLPVKQNVTGSTPVNPARDIPLANFLRVPIPQQQCPEVLRIA